MGKQVSRLTTDFKIY